MITSSGLGSFPAPGIIPYSISKACASFLGQALAFEVKDKIDVMSYECGETSTKLLAKKPSWSVITVDKAVKGCLNDLGHTGLTYGNIIHELIMLMLGLKWPLQYMLNKAAPATMKKYRAKQARDTKKE